MIGRFGRTARDLWIAVATLLVAAFLMIVPELAPAKPYEPQEGPMPEGDPTADDQPSPTPKKKAARFGNPSTGSSPETGKYGARAGHRLLWETYLRLLSRTTIR